MFLKHAKACDIGMKKAKRLINVTQLNNHESARIVVINDSAEITSKLGAMGVIPGAVITKKSAIPARGPVILEKDQVQFAIGYGAARKIMVEPVESETGDVP